MRSGASLQSALERAHAFRTLARSFAPPREDAACEADLAAWAQRAEGSLRRSLDEARRLAACSAALGDEHERLFGGRGGGVPARETSYADARRIAPTDLADLAGFLEAFGVSAAGAPPDHVGTELELASLLALKEAYADAEGWPERAELARHAYEELLRAHLARWLPRFAARVQEAAPDSFYAAVAGVLAQLIDEESARVGVEVTCDSAPLARDDDEPFDCASACPQAAAGRCD
ncbi:MAG: molecular chaperone TorD family protein [Deltaproteobacteria bacterium]|nr:molecular chaperone TorD family protein [Deltaproteobacteria bacterium]